MAGSKEFEWQFEYDDKHCCSQHVDFAYCASYQLSSYVEYARTTVGLVTDDDDAAYPPWTVCDERFGAVAEYDEGLGSVDEMRERERDRDREFERERER